jgi:hypothetical protein
MNEPRVPRLSSAVQRPPHFKGTRGDPIFLQTALGYFFDNAVIPLQLGNVTINLLDYFPLLKQGYTLLPTLSDLMAVYRIKHKLSNRGFIRQDALMLQAFNSDIPAYFYEYSNQSSCVAASFACPTTMIPMEDAIKRGIIPNPLNSFQVISKVIDQDFDLNQITGVFFDRVLDLNYQFLSKMTGFETIVQDQGFINALYDEFMIVRDLMNIISYKASKHGGYLDSTIGIIDILKTSIDSTLSNQLNNRDPAYRTNVLFTLYNRLMADPRVNKLIYAITINDPVMVNKYINDYDPRGNNYEAYNLAVQKNNPVIIDKLKTNIARRNLLEKEAFKTTMVPVGPLDQPEYERLYQYGQSLLPK